MVDQVWSCSFWTFPDTTRYTTDFKISSWLIIWKWIFRRKVLVLSRIVLGREVAGWWMGSTGGWCGRSRAFLMLIWGCSCRRVVLRIIFWPMRVRTRVWDRFSGLLVFWGTISMHLEDSLVNFWFCPVFLVTLPIWTTTSFCSIPLPSQNRYLTVVLIPNRWIPRWGLANLKKWHTHFVLPCTSRNTHRCRILSSSRIWSCRGNLLGMLRDFLSWRIRTRRSGGGLICLSTGSSLSRRLKEIMSGCARGRLGPILSIGICRGTWRRGGWCGSCFGLFCRLNGGGVKLIYDVLFCSCKMQHSWGSKKIVITRLASWYLVIHLQVDHTLSRW